MDDYLSTKHVGWLLDRSPSSIRAGIREGEIEAVRLPGGFRVPRAEALRLVRERVAAEAEGDRRIDDRELERLADEVIARNRQLTGE